MWNKSTMEDNETQPDKTGNIKTIHTYLGDMADAVRENEGSVIKIALAEQNRKDNEEMFKKAEGTKTQKVLLTIGGIILILVAIGGAYYFYQKNKMVNTPTLTTKNIETFIPYDNQISIDVSNINSSSSLLEKINSLGGTGLEDNSVKSIFLTVPKTEIVNKKEITTQELIASKSFLSLIESTAPNSFVNSLSGAYMLGTYKKDTDPALGTFLIFETNDYSLTYARMLEWEKTMLNDLFVLFQIDTTNDPEILTRPFKDVVIENKDVRILYDKDNNAVLFYLFVDRSKFIITDNEDTLKEILARLIVKNTKAQ